MSPSIAFSSFSASGSYWWKKHWTLLCVDEERGQPARSEPERLGAELAGGDSRLEHLLHEVASAENDFFEVEAGGLRKVAQLGLNDAADSGEGCVAHAVVHAGGERHEEIAGRALVGTYHLLGFSEIGHDLGAHHLAEERFLGIEVEVEGALAHAGEASHIVQPGPRESHLTEDFLGRVEDLVGACLRTALPAAGR